MGPQSHIIFLIAIINFLFISSYCSSLEDDGRLNNEYLYNIQEDQQQQETGYDSRAYPSHIFSSVVEDGRPHKLLELSKLQSGKSFMSSYLEKLAADSTTSARIVSVDSYGAKGDGKSDDTQAFKMAWNEACSSSGAVFVVPKNKRYLVKQIRFQGPCRAAITVQIYGIILASNNMGDYKKDSTHWLTFDSVQNLAVDGGGIIDGNGQIWWKNSCKIDKSRPCKDAPTALTFYKGKNLRIKNLKIQNAQQIQTSFESCVNVVVSNLKVTAPGDSPNTDGVHITSTQNMQLSTSVIQTGDDCVSIENGSVKLQITDITCGPGHGISIGSLGDGNSEAHVSDVTVNGAILSGTTNGIRIKTYQGGSGSASNITFENIQMQNVENPIIIDQNYCDQSKPCKQQKSAVQVKNVVYKNIKGTSATNVAIKFDCSKSYPCEGIVLNNINLTAGKMGGKVTASCSNIVFKETANVSPQCPKI